MAQLEQRIGWKQLATIQTKKETLSYEEINNKYKIRCNFLEVLKLRQSILRFGRKAVYGAQNINIDNGIVIYSNNGSKVQV